MGLDAFSLKWPLLWQVSINAAVDQAASFASASAFWASIMS